MHTEETVVMRARPSVVWAMIADPARYPEWMAGITRFDPVADGHGDRGERYSMRMKVGSAEVGGMVEIVERDECKDLAWTSVSGIDQRGRLRVREVEPGVSAVTFRVSYQSPGGFWGLVADRVSGPRVRDNLRESLESLRARTESQDSRTTGGGENIVTLARSQLTAARVLFERGVLRPSRPDRLLLVALALQRWRLTLPGGVVACAARYPHDVAVIDEREQLTFAELDQRSNAVANALRAGGIDEGARVGLLCRNHATFVVALAGLTKLGADALLLNTGFAAPQLREVLEREHADALIHDAEFTQLVGTSVPAKRRYLAWTDSDRTARTTLATLMRRGETTEPVPPERPSRITILTSGTTGAPKGAARPQPSSADPIVGMLSRIPLNSRETTIIAAPLFHAWGIGHLGLGFVLSSTLVLQRKFDPESVLALVEKHGATALIAIPVMLRRILELPEKTRSRYDTSSLRIVAVSGSALPADLAQAFMDEFGDILYNLYGSTEVAAASIATPEDLRAAPGTAGRAPFGTVIRLLDDRDREVPAGVTGRIFVGNDLLFEGYSNGDGTTMVDGLMATGDVGHLDDDGRLFIEGRSDDMIVSGGENVFPGEVEELLLQHPGIGDVAVTGVEDEEWGARLRAYVVQHRGARLTEDSVKQHVRAHLARYKVPRDVVFVAEIPRSTTGKVVKRDLDGEDQGRARQTKTVAGRRRRTPVRPVKNPGP